VSSLKTESATAVQRAFRLRFNTDPLQNEEDAFVVGNTKFEQIGLSVFIYMNYALFLNKMNLTSITLNTVTTICIEDILLMLEMLKH